MKHERIIHVAAQVIMPVIILFGIYLQIHGEDSPGGGFQSGAIIASGYFLYYLINPKSKALISLTTLKIMSGLGVLIYGFTGLYPLLYNGEFLNYNYLNGNHITAQKLGINLVELGVGFTVFSTIMIIFHAFKFTDGEGND